jgi:RNA polymerase sigma-70 factor (ECF subfamily)
MDADDLQLAEAVRRGDARAAEQFVDRFYPRVFAFLRRLAGTQADAEDLTQKTFTRVWRAVARFAGRSSLNSWLHGIAYHVYQDWLRGNHRHEMRPDAWWEECPDPGPPPDLVVADSDLAGTVFAAVDRLDPEIRDTVHLHYYQGLTIEGTAEALGVATSTVKYRLRGAVRLIQSRVIGGARQLGHVDANRRP